MIKLLKEKRHYEVPIQVLPETPEPNDEEARSIGTSESSFLNLELKFEAYLNQIERSKVKRRRLSVEKQPVNAK